jgi:GAF domain-containing protein
MHSGDPASRSVHTSREREALAVLAAEQAPLLRVAQQVERLAAEHSALRRVATLVARAHSPEQLVHTGARFPPEDGNLVGKVFRSGEPARHDGYDRDTAASAVVMRELGVRSAVGRPITVEGSVWGLIVVMSRSSTRLRPDTERGMREFCRYAGMAVANAKSRSDLAESRARIVRAADEARRRVERDLHGGAQQRLVSIALHVRAMGAKLPPESQLGATRSRLGAALDEVLEGLRELSRGIHPACSQTEDSAPH